MIMNNKNMPPKKTRIRVTFDIEKFPNDTKGLRVGDKVVISVNGKLKTGKIQRIFDYPAMNRQEAEIKCDDGMRNFKIEKDITKV
jgi:hypothetical protein